MLIADPPTPLTLSHLTLPQGGPDSVDSWQELIGLALAPDAAGVALTWVRGTVPLYVDDCVTVCVVGMGRFVARARVPVRGPAAELIWLRART